MPYYSFRRNPTSSTSNANTAREQNEAVEVELLPPTACEIEIFESETKTYKTKEGKDPEIVPQYKFTQNGKYFINAKVQGAKNLWVRVDAKPPHTSKPTNKLIVVKAKKDRSDTYRSGTYRKYKPNHDYFEADCGRYAENAMHKKKLKHDDYTYAQFENGERWAESIMPSPDDSQTHREGSCIISALHCKQCRNANQTK